MKDFRVKETLMRLLSEYLLLVNSSVLVKAKHPGILELPPGAILKWKVTKLVKHLVGIGKKKGNLVVARALNNLRRWQRKQAPHVAKRADLLMKAYSKAIRG